LAVDQLHREIEGTLSVHGDALPTARPRLRAVPPVPQPPPWQRRLAAALPPNAGAHDRPAPVLEYHVRPGRSQSDGALLVHMRVRLRKRNGDLGVLGASMQRSAVQDLPPADRWLLAAREEQDDFWYGSSGAWTMSLREPWRVLPSFAAVVLPRLAATGRVFAAGEDGVAPDPQPLQVDGGR